jgi:hypothetical protein
MKMKIIVFFVLSSLLFCCSTGKRILCEQELYNVVNTSVSYTVEMEYNELNHYQEGIYLSSIIITQQDTKFILSNIEHGNIQDLSDESYIFHLWKKTPIQDEYDVSLTNYSPVPSNVQNVLAILNASFFTANSYYAYFQNRNNPFANLLYVFIPENNRIIIYYSIF